MPAGEEQPELEREEHHIVIVQPQREGLEGQTGVTHIVWGSGCHDHSRSGTDHCRHDTGKRQRAA